MKIQPCFDQIQFKFKEFGKPSNIIIPDRINKADVKKYIYGEIIAIGPEVTKFSIGNNIMFLPQNVIGYELPNREPIFFIHEKAVMATFEFEPEDQITTDAVVEA